MHARQLHALLILTTKSRVRLCGPRVSTSTSRTNGPHSGPYPDHRAVSTDTKSDHSCPTKTNTIRRRFFQESLARLASPLADFLSQGSDDSPDTANVSPKLVRHLPPKRPLRPPGAVPEMIFARTCDHSGECVKACPANAIKLSTDYSDEPTPLHRCQCHRVCRVRWHFVYSSLPVGSPSTSFCRRTNQHGFGQSGRDSLPCEAPALKVQTTTSNFQPINRSTSNPEDCTICVERCPIGEVALRFDGAGPPIVDDSRLRRLRRLRTALPAPRPRPSSFSPDRHRYTPLSKAHAGFNASRCVRGCHAFRINPKQLSRRTDKPKIAASIERRRCGHHVAGHGWWRRNCL